MAVALNEIAPDAKLYVSNANDRIQVVAAARWLLSKGDVRVINRSRVAPWDGPGNGTSPYDMDGRRSPLNVVDDAVEHEILWVNSAGNAADRTWFKRNPSFDSNNYLIFNATGNFQTCNRVELKAGTFYTFQARWNGAWRASNVDLNVHLFGPVTASGTGGAFLPTMHHMPQTGLSDHVPHELFDFTLGSNQAAGTYCLYVSRNPNNFRFPAWIQLQMFSDTGTLTPATATGSLDNPAEGANDGMLAVGATNRSGNMLESFSARGPAPEPASPERVALDIVSLGFNPDPAGSSGTSFASPRVAGLAALIIGALGDREEYDEPEEIAQYMKHFGSTIVGSDFRNCANDWGCGFAVLHPLDPPTNVRVERTACGTPLRDWNLTVDFDEPMRLLPSVRLSYVVELKESGEADAEVSSLRRSGLRPTARVAGDKAYQAKAYTCLNAAGPLLCGEGSVASSSVAFPLEVCTPGDFAAYAGEGTVTLVWEDEPDSTGYEVERDAYNFDDDDVHVTTGQHLVVDGLLAGGAYNFRIRAIGSSGTSGWSDMEITVPRHVGTVTLPAIGRVVQSPNENRLSLYDAVISWSGDPNSATYEIRIRKAGTSDWQAPPSVVFDYLGHGFGARVAAKLGGLDPGSEYEIQVRGFNGDFETPWTETLDFTTLGRRPVESTARPSKPSEPRILVSSVQPFPRVVLQWDAPSEDYLHAIRVLGGGASTWKRLPFQPAGWNSPYSVRYLGDSGAFIAGLIPGTEYHFAVRAANERNSPEVLDHSPWSEVVTVMMPGTRPSNAPGSVMAPALKAPPEDLMAVVDGTTVNLSWTATTNPNYTSQRLLRRVAGVSPIDWTEIPLGVDATTYTDTGLTSGVTYRYRVRGYKDSGNYGEEKGGYVDAVIP